MMGDKEMDRLCVFLFGKFCVKYKEVELQGFQTLKVQELFCYLLLYRNRPHPRENLASLLWGDNSTSQAKRYLSKALWQLQAALSQATQDDNLLLVEPDWIQLNNRADFWLDVAVFEQAYYLLQEVPGEELEASELQTLQEAIQRYRGDLLEGWYQDWCLCERERLQFFYLALLDKLIRFCEAHGEFEAGRMFGYKILSYDRAREQTHRQLMRLYFLSGDRTGALRQYQHCQEILKQELGVSPSRRTEELYAKIHADEPIRLPSNSQPSIQSKPNSTEGRVWRLVDKMKQLRIELENMERDLQSFTRTIKTTGVKET
jgi:DNA-binding SARP family transcriptional activator